MNCRNLARKMVIILICLIILLSGCSSSNSVGNEEAKKGEEVANIHTGKNLNQKNEATNDLVTDNSSPKQEIPEINKEKTGENITANGKEEVRKEKKENGNESDNNNIANIGNIDNIIELIPKAQLPDLNMDPQKSYSVEEAVALRTAILTPVYHDTFRYQIREFTRNPSRLVIDIGNTSETTLVITDDNLYFSIFDSEGNNCAESKVQGSPVSIAPGEVKRVVVTAQNPDAGVVLLEFGGMNYSLSNPYYRALPNEESDIVNTKPYSHGYVIYDDEGNPYYMAEVSREVVGNGKAKIMAEGVLPVENEKIGPIDKGDGFLTLVKVKIANTTDEEMAINKILSNGAGENATFTTGDLAVLGEKALPSTIKPHTIVEGWIPFRVGDGREGYSIVIYTSHGGFVLNSVNTYLIL